MKRFLLAVMMILLCGFSLFSQEKSGREIIEQEEAAQEEAEQQEPEQEAGETDTEENDADKDNKRIIELDIKTSTLMELAAWCRDLGLSEGGTRDDLANRLRSHYQLPASGGTVSENRKVITIEAARTTEYFTIEAIDEEYARLRGDVVISLKDGDAIHRVKAWEILYNRTRNILTASGGVEYVKEEGSTIETFKGESITVNLDNWSSIFLDGLSERSVSGGDTAYRFSGTVISRNSEEVTVLTRAEITNGNDPEALWSIYASKLWLLPGSDFAFLNAILKVGSIPVLWLPFFYYPSDEIIFHPILGSRTRDGSFFQTTTYILGRPKSSWASENSITKIFGSGDDSEKVREGVFLRSTGKRTVNTEGPTLSVLFDAYTNLGFYLGTEFSLPRMGNFGAFTLSLGLGMTRDIYNVYGNYTPYKNHDGVSDWNDSFLFGAKIPMLRYRMEMNGSFNLGRSALSWHFPLYSDPYVNRDFLNRSEEFDWLSMIREGASATAQEPVDSSLSGYYWELRLGAIRPELKKLSPYISSAQISSISSNLAFNSRDTSPGPTPSASPPNPGSKFFYPNKFTIYSVSASMDGTPYRSSFGQARTSEKTVPAAESTLLPGLPLSPWEEPASESSGSGSGGDSFALVPPLLAQSFSSSSVGGAPQLVFNYSLSPTAASELQFRNFYTHWKTMEDIDWSEKTSVLTDVRGNFNMGLSLTHAAYSGSFKISNSGSWRGYNYLNEDAEEFASSGTVSVLKTAYGQRRISSKYDFSASLKPLFWSSVWKDSSIQYSLRGLVAEMTFDTASVVNSDDTPVYNWEFIDWNKKKLDSHSITLNLNASVMDKVQNISLSAVLPPRNAEISGNATFRIWISETRFSTSVHEPFDSDLRKFGDMTFIETMTHPTIGTFSSTVVYIPEDNEVSRMSFALNLNNIAIKTKSNPFNLGTFSANLTYSSMIPYKFNFNGRVDPSNSSLWIQETNGVKGLNPQELYFSYSPYPFKKDFWEKRISFSAYMNTNLRFDLQRYTNSNLYFSMGMGWQIVNFLDFTFTATSTNNQIYKYYPNAARDTLPDGVETNFFADLFHSLPFASLEQRRSSAFKLDRLSMNFVHHLGDWDATLGLTLLQDRTALSPGSTGRRLGSTFNFTIEWKPIKEIRTKMTVENNDKITFE